MTRAKELLDAATPLPWAVPPADEDRYMTAADLDLIVYAVNALPAYEAAVEALREILRLNEGLELHGNEDAREALRRLQEQTQ